MEMAKTKRIFAEQLQNERKQNNHQLKRNNLKRIQT